MTRAEFAAAARDRLDAAGYRVVTLEHGEETVVATRSDRRASFAFGTLETTAVVAAVDRSTPAEWEVFVGEAFELARGDYVPAARYATFAAIPVLGVERLDEATAAAARSRWEHGMIGVCEPAVVDLATGAVHCYRGRAAQGVMFRRFLRAQLDVVTGSAG